MPHTDSIIDILDLQHGVAKLDTESRNFSVEKIHYIEKAHKLDIDLVYFSGNIPAVYIKKVKQFDTETIHNIAKTQKNIWNQGKVALLYVEGDTEIRISGPTAGSLQINLILT